MQREGGMYAGNSLIILNAHAHVCDYRVYERGVHGYVDEFRGYGHSIDYCAYIACTQ